MCSIKVLSPACMVSAWCHSGINLQGSVPVEIALWVGMEWLHIVRGVLQALILDDRQLSVPISLVAQCCHLTIKV